MSNKKALIDKDTLEIYDLAWGQIKEDREKILDVYTDLREMLRGNPERYAVSGADMAKFGELLIKHTAQVIELLKIVHKNKESDDSLSDEDMEKIKRAIDNQ